MRLFREPNTVTKFRVQSIAERSSEPRQWTRFRQAAKLEFALGVGSVEATVQVRLVTSLARDKSSQIESESWEILQTKHVPLRTLRDTSTGKRQSRQVSPRNQKEHSIAFKLFNLR